MSINTEPYMHPIEADARWENPFTIEGHMTNYYGEEMAPAPDSNELSYETTLRIEGNVSKYEEQLLEVMLEIAAIAETPLDRLNSEDKEALEILETEAIILEAELSLESSQISPQETELEDIFSTLLCEYAERHSDKALDVHAHEEIQLLARHYSDVIRQMNIGTDVNVLKDAAEELHKAIVTIIDELRSQYIDQSIKDLVTDRPLIRA